MIQLTKDLAMTADQYGYTVGKPFKEKDNYVRLKNPTYYGTAAQAVRGALSRTLHQGIADGSITTLRQFVQEQERLRDEFQRLLAPLDETKQPYA